VLVRATSRIGAKKKPSRALRMRLFNRAGSHEGGKYIMSLDVVRKSAAVIMLFTGVSIACGGQNPPGATTPPEPASAQEGNEMVMPESEHTMPDGTKMPGHSHDNEGEHTMPDGTSMEGDEHAD
jgi:hypothetical protein